MMNSLQNNNLFEIALGRGGKLAKLWVVLICLVSGFADLAAVSALALVMARLLGLPLPDFAPKFLVSGDLWPSISVFAAATFLRLICNFETARIGQYGEANISKEIFSRLISKDIDYLSQFKNSEFKRQILSEVQQVSNNYLYPTLRLAQSTPSFVLISGSLMVNLPSGMILTFSVMLMIFVFVALLMRKIGAVFGEKRFAANEKRFLELERTFVNIRFIKTLALIEIVAERFGTAMKQYAFAQTAMQLLSQAPKFIFEIILIFSVGFYEYLGGGVIQNGSIAVLFAAAYRLIPIGQLVTQNLSRLAFGGKAVEDLSQRLASLSQTHEVYVSGNDNAVAADTSVLEIAVGAALLLEINDQRTRSVSVGALTTTVVMGESGIGKTTILDVIAGLRTSNDIRVTGWSRDRAGTRLFYLPQQAFLPDGDIFEVLNYFGISATSDQLMDRLSAYNLAHLSDRLLLSRDILGGSQEFSGLSGGEMKRLFLLIADVSDKFLVLLDEPFVGLDDRSADEMANAINELAGRRSIILVTHFVPDILRYDKLMILRSTVDE